MFKLGTNSEISDFKSAFREVKDFRQIKPEGGMKFEDAQKFWDNLFSREIMPDKNILRENMSSMFSDLDTMKQELGKTYGEIKEDKPINSPNIAKWFANGGKIEIIERDGRQVWRYIDNAGREVSYVNGYPVFPLEAKHPVVQDISIGKFTGDRNEDKRLYLEKLEEQYGLTEIPDGYALHHDSKNGNMQLIKMDWHKEFTHAGGHSLFRED